MTNSTETVESVLAEMRESFLVKFGNLSIIKEWADRLAAAHEREVVEMDDSIERLCSQIISLRETAARAEAAEGLLREYRAASKFGDDKTIRETLAIEDRIDAHLSGATNG